jgi:hypothetical protein
MLVRARGFIAMLSVIVIGAILLIVGLATASMGQTQLQVAAGTHEEHRTRDYAAGCLEEAMMRLKRDETTPFASYPAVIPMPGVADTCSITSLTGSGSTRTVAVSSTVGFFTKAVSATLTKQTNPGGQAVAWVITSWTEVDP